MKFKNDIEKYEFFELVLNKKVSTAAGEEFERALRDNPVLALEFKEYEELHELVLDDSILNLKETLQHVHERATKSNVDNRRERPGNQFIITILTGMLVISGILFFHNRSLEKENSPERNNKTRVQVIMDSVIYESQEKTEGLPGSQASEPLDSYLIVQPKTLRKVEKKVDNKEAVSDTNKKNPTEEKPVESIQQITKKENTIEVLPFHKNDTQAILLTKHKSESATLSESEEETTDCNKVNLKYRYEKQNACVEYVSGEIRVLKHTLSGGTPPYYISIDGGFEFFSSRYVFDGLKPGDYQLVIKDHNNCKEEAETIVIEEKICQTEYKYSPLKGEPWIIPFEKEKSGTFNLFSGSGQVLVEKYLDPYGDKTWYGKDDNGMPLRMGYYPFIIRYDDGEIFRGSVTLVK